MKLQEYGAHNKGQVISKGRALPGYGAASQPHLEKAPWILELDQAAGSFLNEQTREGCSGAGERGCWARRAKCVQKSQTLRNMKHKPINRTGEEKEGGGHNALPQRRNTG